MCVPWVRAGCIEGPGRNVGCPQDVPQLLQHKWEKEKRKSHKLLNINLPFFGAYF